MPFYKKQDYLMFLYASFCPTPEASPETEAAAEQLWQTLSVPQRKMLLELEDKLNAQRDVTTFASFVAGFRVAVGITFELRGNWYSFDDDEERRAREAFEREHDTMIHNKERYGHNHE